MKFEGGYHGHADSFLSQAGSGLATLGIAECPGVPQALAALTLNVPYNDLAAVERLFAENKGKIAAVIVEPVAANMGVVVPKEGFLQGLRELTRQERGAADYRRSDYRIPAEEWVGAGSVRSRRRFDHHGQDHWRGSAGGGVCGPRGIDEQCGAAGAGLSSGNAWRGIRWRCARGLRR